MTVKRVFDLLFSALGMLILSPVFLVVAILIKIDSKGPIYFRQERVGKNSEVFQIHKFRTMEINSEHLGKITIGEDKRITNLGKWLRKNKIDELPQLIDVLYGKMSLVGPRPELKAYVDTYPKDIKKKILSVKPGITDYASITMIDESLLLANYSNPQEAYAKSILPKKLELSTKYVDSSNIFLDFKIIFLTLQKIFLKR
ncbi:sugar transferase [Candidatus Thioglobus sp.]|nr:sugar transferase [Candidatus Thioglobus sp.]MDA9060494.1 sugar transferase [Candidatus Thioglobus sp.]